MLAAKQVEIPLPVNRPGLYRLVETGSGILFVCPSSPAENSDEKVFGNRCQTLSFCESVHRACAPSTGSEDALRFVNANVAAGAVTADKKYTKTYRCQV